MPSKEICQCPNCGTNIQDWFFEKMKDEFYEIRGWDVRTGLQTRSKLEDLNLGDVADTLAKENLLG